MTELQKHLLEKVADLHEVPAGAYNIRMNGQSGGRRSTEHIEIIPKTDRAGIDIKIAPGTKNESLHIPVIVAESGLHDLVYNDFYIGEGADVTIVAGCGIHNSGDKSAEHSGIHTFYVGKNARVKYIEKHYGEGDGNGENVMHPKSVVVMESGSYMEMDTCQIKGIDSTNRVTEATLADAAVLKVSEKIMTHGKQRAETNFSLALNGEDAGAHIVSRSVAKDESYQCFRSAVAGNNRCHAHTECDAILMDRGCVTAIPEVTANHVDASLIHEAAIGKIAGEQLLKLMTLGLTEKEAEETIVSGFLK